MRLLNRSIFLFFFLVPALIFAQTTLPIPNDIKKAYLKGTRNLNGMPGSKYWQNSAHYQIQVQFQPSTRLLSGSVLIDYENNSPDTLKELVFKLYPNLYKAGSMRTFPVEPEDIGNGMTIHKLVVAGTEQDFGKVKTEGTNMWVPIHPLAPHQNLKVELEFFYTVNKTSHIRTGQVDEGSFFIAYFFPRITVYDDIEGWNLNPYLGTQEFYHDFCDFNVAITVPKDFVVWATGDLVNAKEVLNEKIYERLQQSEKTDQIITVIDSTELKGGKVTAQQPTNTFRFEAVQVPDFSFALSDHYMWQAGSLVVDSSTGRRTRAEAVYHPRHKYYYPIAGDAWKTVQAMSYRFPAWPYPYNHITVFDGLDEMEYPMMVNAIPLADREENVQLTNHEIFHTMFPFYMGINETKYGWMDEGWGTIGEWLISPMLLPGTVDLFGLDSYQASAGNEIDLPVLTPTTQLQGIYYNHETPFFINSYTKPGLGYLYVKDMLGDPLFQKALHHYISSWHGKHPIPWDFFESINQGSGKNLDWFWKPWFFETGYPDLAFKSVSGGNRPTSVVIEKKGNKPVPVELVLQYADGSSEKIHNSIAVWEKGNRTTTIKLHPKQAVTRIQLGGTYIPDAFPSDNTWETK